MKSSMMRNFVYERHERTLRRMRSKNFPPCTSLDDLDNLLKNNPQIRSAFGTFRREDFYAGLVKEENSTGSIFVFNPVLKEMQGGCDLFIDATFNILPLNLQQLLIILADVQGKVSTRKKINN